MAELYMLCFDADCKMADFPVGVIRNRELAEQLAKARDEYVVQIGYAKTKSLKSQLKKGGKDDGKAVEGD